METDFTPRLEMKYFVLKPRGNNIYARASRCAMIEYASVIEDENPSFAEDIKRWVHAELDYLSEEIEGRQHVKISLWSEGFESTGQTGGAMFHGVFTAVDLRDAVKQFRETITDDRSKKCVDVDRLTFWGCRFFDNEVDARRNFG